MKSALRNLTLAAALTLSGTMFAQAPTPTVTQKWLTELGFASGDFRSGTGVNGTVYMSGTNIIKAINAGGVKDYKSFSGDVTITSFNKGMSADDAGNLFVLKGWPTGSGTTNAYLISNDLKTIKEVEVAKPETDKSFPLGRSDVQGRAVGDFFSEEGGALFIYPQNQTHPACIMFKNGEPVAAEKITSATGASANSMAVAVPAVGTIQEFNASSAPWDDFYMRNGNVVQYVGSDGKAATLDFTDYPAGYASSTQNGFDVFSLGGVTYQVRYMNRTGKNWGSDFLIADLAGNVIFHTEYDDDYVGTTTGNGCNLIARKVSDYKVELYQVYTTTVASKCFAAMYEITIPEPTPLYIAGAQMGWTVGDGATKFSFDYGKNKYVYTGFKGGQFKITTDASDWTAFDANALFPAVDPVGGMITLAPNQTYSLSKSGIGGVNISVPAGEYTIEVSPDFSDITVSGEETVEEQDVYLVGAVNGWTLPGTKLELVDNNYVYSGYTGGDFKISVGETTVWDSFNANTIYPTDGSLILEPNQEYAIAVVGGDRGNISVTDGDYSILISKNLTKLTVSGEEKFVPKPLYLIGEFNNWAEPGVAFEYNPEPVDGKVVYTLTLPQLGGEFLVAAAGYSPKYGGGTFSNGGVCQLTLGGANNTCAEVSNATVTFTLPVDKTQSPVLTVAAEANDDRKPYAYALKAESDDLWYYTISFKATGASDEAELVLTDANGEKFYKSLGAVEKGLNTFELIDLHEYRDGDYAWGISLKGNLEGDAPVKVTEMSLPNGTADYVGITVIRDPEAESYGYTVIGMSGLHGYMVFDPAGTLLYGGPIHADWQAQTFSHGSSNTMYGNSYMGNAVFANWNDQAAGYWVVNPLEPKTEPYNMLQSPGATMASSGLWSLNGTAIGGGSTAIAFANLGEETFVVNFDEDYNDASAASKTNNVYTRRIKTGDKYITVKPANTIVCGTTAAGLATSDKGYFVTQSRGGNGDKGNYSLLRYYNFNNELLYDAGVEKLIPSSCANVACNADGTLLALTTYNSTTKLYSVNYAEPAQAAAIGGKRAVENSQSVPELTEIATIPTAVSGNNPRPDMDFDAAGNLHIADRLAQKYSVYAIPGESKSYTSAPANIVVRLQTGVEDVTTDADANAPVEYFNIQGVGVNADNLTPGIYVRRQGNTVTKVIIR